MNQGKEVLIRAVQDSSLLVVELNLVVVPVVELKIPTQKYILMKASAQKHKNYNVFSKLFSPSCASTFI